VNSLAKHLVDFSEANLPSIRLELIAELFDRAPDIAFFVKDSQGRYVVVNESLAARHGLKSKADAIGKRPCDICFGEFGRIPSEQDAKVLKTGRPLVDQLEMQWHRPNNPVWCLTTKLPIRESNGNVTGLIGFSRDIRQAIIPQDIPQKFALALQEFDQSLSSEVTPAWLAVRSGVPQHRLFRIVKRVFGLTPSQFITKARIAAASRMLRDGNKSISEIAHACGFCDHSAFTRAFRATCGMTPTEFRSHQ
jgi:PAS domain S-box-containing protein